MVGVLVAAVMFIVWLVGGVIGKIAIEAKGPTDYRALDSITTKYLKCRDHFERVIFLFFDPMYSPRHFSEIRSGITRDWPEVEIIIKVIEQ